MQLDNDVAILGTGIAPLIAANHLSIQGKSVLLLNPDLDFYLEDSELPLDPLLEKIPRLEKINRSSPDTALSILRPEFPGAIEFWSPHHGQTGYHDSTAPHIHQRGRLWISTPDKTTRWEWETLEDLFVEASDAGMNPQILDGITAARRFPGYASNTGNFRGLYLPKICDVDILRYRNGLLEYIRERLGSEKIICSVSSLEWMPDGIRFRSANSLHTAKISEGMLVFWTPRLTSWITKQAKKAEVTPKPPKGVRVWEQWLIHSREAIDPSTVGMFKNMTIWSDFEGTPQSGDHTLAVLRSGPLVPLERIQLPQGGLSWASADSFNALSNLCNGFLKWDRYSIRSMRPRAIFEWDQQEIWCLSKSAPLIQVIPACDGPLIDVVRVARNACDHLLKSFENQKSKE